MIFVWEGTVATLPDNAGIRTLEYLARRGGQWRTAVGYWKVNQYGLKWMWSVLERSTLRIDICVTTRPPGFAEAVARKCEQENWPVGYVFAEAAPELGRRLATMPDVERVVYALEEQRWAYGPHGYRLTPDSGQLV
jgi:hypothetical protein